MKPEFICDGCNESLKDKMEEDETIYILSDSIGGFGVMDHHNCPNYIILCEECEEQVRDQLKEEEDWISLEQWDGFGGCKDYYEDFNKLKSDIINLSKEKKNEQSKTNNIFRTLANTNDC